MLGSMRTTFARGCAGELVAQRDSWGYLRTPRWGGDDDVRAYVTWR